MSPPKLPKKLKPAKMAWKTFADKLHSNLQKLHIPPSIKAVSRRFLQFCSLRLYAPFKKRFLARSSSFPFHHHHYYHHQNKPYRNTKAVFIDRLYADHAYEQGASSSRGKAVADNSFRNRKNLQRRKEEELVEENGDYSIEDAWKHVVASSPHLREVDDRAEEFIYKFKEEMKLEKEKSLLEFQERLARSS